MSYSKDNITAAGDYNSLAGLTGTAAANDAAAEEVAGYLYGIGYGSRGYGQSSPALAAVAKDTIIANWSSLQTVLSTLCAWNGTSTTNLPSAPSLAKDAATKITAIPALLTALDANRLDYDVGNMTLVGLAATSTRGSPWDTNITCEFSVTFASENAARYFFNTGGEIRIALDHPSTATPQDTNWHDILDDLVVAFQALESVRLTGSTGTATNVGYYDLTTSYQTILDGTNAGTGAYAANDYLVEAKAASITGLNGAKGSAVWFRVTLTDEHTNVFSDSVSDGTTATLSHLRADDVLSSLPAAPTCSTETNF